MGRNKPDYDHWINKWKQNPSYRVKWLDRLIFITIGFLCGYLLGLAI